MYPDTTMRRGVRYPGDGTNTDSPASDTTRSAGERSGTSGVKRMKGGRISFGEEEYVLVSKHDTAITHRDRLLDVQKGKTKRLEREQSYRSFDRRDNYNNNNHGGGGGGGNHDRRPQRP